VKRVPHRWHAQGATIPQPSPDLRLVISNHYLCFPIITIPSSGRKFIDACPNNFLSCSSGFAVKISRQHCYMLTTSIGKGPFTCSDWRVQRSQARPVRRL